MSTFTGLNQNNLEKRKQEISDIDWNNFVKNTDYINISFQRFYDTLISVLIKTYIEDWTWSRKKVPKKPWLSTSLVRCINMKDKLYKIQ